MDVTITYKMSEQISSNDWDCWTEVINVDENATMNDVLLHIKKINRHWQNFTGEIHFRSESNRVVPAEVVEKRG